MMKKSESPGLGSKVNGKATNGTTEAPPSDDTAETPPSGEERQQTSSEVPDGGWGWFCVLGCAMMHYLLGGTERSFGIIYIELLDRFQGSAALTAWIPAMNTAVRMFCGPFVSMLVNKYGCRRIVMIGGLLSSLGYVLSAFAPNLYYLYFSMALLAGFGGSLSYSPSLVIVGKYFNKKRAIATGLGCAGTGVGSFSIPPLFQLLLVTYGYYGTMIVYGGLMLNLCVAGALYRPLSANVIKNTDRVKLLSSGERENSDKQQSLIGDDLELKEKPISNDEFCHKNGKHADDNESTAEASNLLIHSVENSKSEHPVNVNKGAGDSSVKYAIKNSSKPKQKLFDWSLLKDKTYLALGFTIFFYAQGYLSSIILLPALAKERGIDRTWIDGILATVGICDFIGRVSSGLVFDAKKIRPHRRHLFNAAILVSGISSFCCIFAFSKPSFLVIAVVFGLSTAVIVSQRSVIMADLLGVEKLSSSFGFSTVFQGAAALIGPAFGGLLKDLYGSYTYVYCYCGVSTTFGAILFMSEYFLTKYHRSRSSHSPSNKIV